jgi:AcrR family transcriptional regulator
MRYQPPNRSVDSGSMGAPVTRGTRERILEAAEAFFGERGYSGTRLHHIAERVGVQKASLFHYFPSKEELYRAVLEHSVGDAERTITHALESRNTPLERVCLLIESWIDLVAAHPQRLKILLRQSLGDAPPGYQTPDNDRLLALIVGFITEGQMAKVFAPVDALASVLSVVGMVAFFFTSAPVLAPSWCSDPSSADAVERVKRHVTDVMRRCLAGGGETGSSCRPAVA